MREIKEDLTKCEDVPCSWIERLNIVKMTIFLQLLYSHCNPYQHPSWLFCNKLQDDPEIHMEIQGPQNGQNYLEKE